MTIEFYQDLYRIELERMQQLNASLSLPVGLLTLLGGLLLVMVKEFAWSGGTVEAVFIVLVGAATFSLLASAFQLARSFWGHSFQYLAKPDELRQWESALVAHFKVHASDGIRPEEEAEREFEARAIDRLTEATSFNATQNDRRSEHLFWANGLVLLTLLLTGFAGIPYSLATPLRPEQNEGVQHDRTSRAATATSAATAEQDCQISSFAAVIPTT